MDLGRRKLLRITAGAAMFGLARPVAAQSYPTRQVRILVGFEPGGAADILARLLAQWLSRQLGQPFIVENHPGAGSSIATAVVVRAPADGYTLLLCTIANAVNATLYDQLEYNFLRDVRPVASLCRAPLVMEVHPSLPAASVPEFIAFAKANPGKLSVASPGIGSAPHVAAELFKKMVGIDMVHVPYRGSAAALTDLLAGRVQVMFCPLPATIDHLRAGSLRALAVTTTRPAQELPDIPPVAAFVPGYEASAWFGVGAPRLTADTTIDILNREVNAGLAAPVLKSKLADLGYSVFAGSPVDFATHLSQETEKWRDSVRAGNIRPD
jgi:tripartite-type tricarboxylate transporter receptor subunit TctC